MIRLPNVSRLRAILLPYVLALTPALAMAQAQPSPPPVSAPQSTPPSAGMAGSGMQGHPMMNDDKTKPGAGGMNCMGKPCGPPQGTAGQTGGMGSTGSSGSATPPAPPAAKVP